MNDEKTKYAKNGKLPIVIALVIVLGLVGFRMVSLFTPDDKVEEEPISVEVTKAEMIDIITSAPIAARVKPIEEVNVLPLMQGKVTGVYANVGDKVAAGEILFSIDASQLESKINQAQEAERVAADTFDRMKTLYSEGAVAYQDYEQAKLNYVNAQQSYIQAASAYEDCNVKSPISGYITANNLNVGTLPPQTQPSMIVVDVSSLVVEAEISESVVAVINEGDSVEVYVDSVSKEPISGVIKSISPAPTAGKMTYPIKVALPKTEKVKAGMFAKIQIVNSGKQDVLCVPSDSVMIKDGEKTLAILKKDKPKFVKVTTGIDNGKYVEIIDGITEGTLVITKGQQYVKEGEAVKLIKKEATKDE